MPELPEVETVRNTLKKYVINKKISHIDIYWNNIIVGDNNEFKQKLLGQVIHDVERYGKFLVFILDTDVLVSHLRMEGKYFINNIADPILNHTHVIFTFDDQSQLRYNDVRKFGTMEVIDKQQYLSLPPLSKLGKEPFKLTAMELFDKIKNKSIAIKTVLLDQSIISGLGNIYVNEVLFYCKINPQTPSKFITIDQCENIIVNSITVLNKAIALGGTTIDTFDSNGIHGKFQNHLLVHGKEKENCVNCGSKIEKTFVNGRGTYYCPICQKGINEYGK